MRPGETQIVIRHELRAGSSSDPIAVIPRLWPARRLRPFIHRRNGSCVASISAGQAVVSCPINDREKGIQLFP
jgi:hypothetical protein